METKNNGWTDFGWMNFWDEPPALVVKAENDPEARFDIRKIRKDQYEYVCEKYRFRYRVDSSY